MKRRARLARRRDDQPRKFRIYRAPFRDAWRWECSLCDPPVWGQRCGPGAWQRIIDLSMPHHFRVRSGHHEWVRGKP